MVKQQVRRLDRHSLGGANAATRQGPDPASFSQRSGRCASRQDRTRARVFCVCALAVKIAAQVELEANRQQMVKISAEQRSQRGRKVVKHEARAAAARCNRGRPRPAFGGRNTSAGRLKTKLSCNG